MNKLFHAMNSSNQEYGTPGFLTDEYLYLHINEYIHAQIKMDEEGVCIDMYPPQVVDEPIATTWVLYNEAKGYKKHLNDQFKVTDVYGREYGEELFCLRTENVCCVQVKNLNVQFEFEDNELHVNVFGLNGNKSLGGFKVKAEQFV